MPPWADPWAAAGLGRLVNATTGDARSLLEPLMLGILFGHMRTDKLCGVADPAGGSRMCTAIRLISGNYLATHGWHQEPSLALEPNRVGLHALFLEHTLTRRGMVVFKATSKSDSLFSQADYCSAWALFDNAPADADQRCAAFAGGGSWRRNRSLDVWTDATSYALRLRAARPDLELLYTGFSVAGSLAAMVSLWVATLPGANGAAPAVAFAPKLWGAVLRRQMPAVAAAVAASTAPSRIVSIGVLWDPEPFTTWGDEAGTLVPQTFCVYRSEPPPESCVQCFRMPPPGNGMYNFDLESADCRACYLQRHREFHYWRAATQQPPPACVVGATRLSQLEAARFPALPFSTRHEVAAYINLAALAVQYAFPLSPAEQLTLRAGAIGAAVLALLLALCRCCGCCACGARGERGQGYRELS